MSLSLLNQGSKVLAIAALVLVLAPRAHAATSHAPRSSDSSYSDSQDEDQDVDQDQAEESGDDEVGTRSATTQSPVEEEDAAAARNAASTTVDVPQEQDAVEVRDERTPIKPAAPAAAAPAPGTPATAKITEAEPSVGGEFRAPSPKTLDPDRRGYFQLGVGPAYGAAFVSDSLMYNVVGSYNFNSSDKFTIKALADLYMATGSVSSRLYNFGVGAEYYAKELETDTLSPYAAADLGIGFARNAEDATGTALTLGAGAGFKFQVNQLNCDINAHYAQLTANVGPSAPAIFALRGAVAF